MVERPVRPLPAIKFDFFLRRPCGAHGIQRSFLKIIASFARMTIEVWGYDIADLPEAVAGGMQMSLLS
jgi:hypothetical protein